MSKKTSYLGMIRHHEKMSGGEGRELSALPQTRIGRKQGYNEIIPKQTGKYVG